MAHRTMYDSVDVAAIPQTATLVAGYLDGRYETVPALRKRFPHAQVVTITVTGTRLDADVADVERGDLTPAHGADWAKRKIAAKQGHPTLYTSVNAWPAVQGAVRAAGLGTNGVSYWVAHYDGIAQVPAGAIAKQYQDPPRSGGNFDLSAVAVYWPGVDTRRPAVVYPWLRQGSTKHWWVRRLQTWLNLYLGAHLAVDGLYGPKTAAAVREVQRRRHWRQTGVAGTGVWLALAAALHK